MRIAYLCVVYFTNARLVKICTRGVREQKVSKSACRPTRQAGATRERTAGAGTCGKNCDQPLTMAMSTQDLKMWQWGHPEDLHWKKFNLPVSFPRPSCQQAHNKHGSNPTHSHGKKCFLGTVCSTECTWQGKPYSYSWKGGKRYYLKQNNYR